MAFNLSVYPWVYVAKFGKDGKWSEDFQEKPHKTPEEEASLAEDALQELLRQRNSFPDLPLVNYTTQYGMGCFEGMKAFPQADGSLKLFRPDENGKRFARSMEGLKMPVYDPEMFLQAAKQLVKKNYDLGFFPSYDPAWEKDDFQSGHAVYVRPFSYSEPAIGLGLSLFPWVVMASTPVGSYFRPGSSSAVTTEKVRAFPGGTGWIKCDANYVVPTLTKKEAEKEGYMEAIFLDAYEKTYVEEGSSCNIFFLLKNGTLVTPALQDTILPGITRKSIIALARSKGTTVEERKIAIDEVMSDAIECFVTGTAAGIAHIESITHKGSTTVFNNRKIGELSHDLQITLKGIQYGKVEDSFGWMFPLE